MWFKRRTIAEQKALMLRFHWENAEQDRKPEAVP